jgi:hypothetical protein
LDGLHGIIKENIKVSKGLKEFINEIISKRNYFMSVIGWMVISTMLYNFTYQLIEINLIFRKGLITEETWSRENSNILNKIVELGMLILVFYFTKTNNIEK